MSTKITSFFLLLLIAGNMFAAKTVIKGYAPGAENLAIRLYTYDDYISNRETLLTTALVDSTGHFIFSINVYEKQVITGFLRIMNFDCPEIYIPSGKQYEIEFAPFDYRDPNRIQIPLLSTILLEYTFKNADAHDVNQLISAFNVEYSGFIIKTSGIDNQTSTYSVKRPPQHLVDSFVTAITAKYKGETNEFFRNYYHYSLANLQLNLQSKSKKYLFDTYFYKKPIIYDNVAYMEFFNNFFTDFIYGTSKKIKPYDIVLNVNIKPNLSGLIDSLGKDTMLKNEQLREAVLLLNIRDWFTSNTFKQDSLIKILDLYAGKTKFDIQSRIARNLKFMLTRFNSGVAAPPMSFKSINNEVFNNDSLKTKYTYIIFFTTWSHSCLSELLVLNQLQKDWKDSIRFVAVSMDCEPLKLFYFLEENKFEFPVYHFGNDWVMAENIGLQSYPHAMLINKSGALINFCAPVPSHGIVNVFNKLAGAKVIINQPNVGQ